MRAKSKKVPASTKRAPKPAMKIGRKLASAMKQLRRATEKARKADPEFDRLYRRLHRSR